MTKKELNDLVKSVGYHVMTDEAGDTFAQFGADNDFDHDLLTYFIADENSLQFMAFANDYKIPAARLGEAVLWCNEWNTTHKVPKAYVDQKQRDFIVEWSIWTDVPISDAYLKENFISLGVGSAAQFFQETAKKFG